ncbi:ANR family transcriptional regulator [Salmonella enterica]|nr:ANR family transcriptional regulator [Salmonella enterica]
MSFKYRDSPLYYRTAREAVRIEREGDYWRAAKVWAKANRESRNELNQDWSERRSDFCLMQIGREKLKEAE